MIFLSSVSSTRRRALSTSSKRERTVILRIAPAGRMGRRPPNWFGELFEPGRIPGGKAGEGPPPLRNPYTIFTRYACLVARTIRTLQTLVNGVCPLGTNTYAD